MQTSPAPVTTRPDLTPIFPELQPSDVAELQELLVQLNARIVTLSTDVGAHIDQAFAYPELRLFDRQNDGLLSATPFSPSCQLSFEIEYPMRPGEVYAPLPVPPWIITSEVAVLCDEQPPRVDVCMHTLLRIEGCGTTPRGTLEAFGRHIQAVRDDVLSRPASEITEARHSDLPARD